jgi:hypothetical protein
MSHTAIALLERATAGTVELLAAVDGTCDVGPPVDEPPSDGVEDALAGGDPIVLVPPAEPEPAEPHAAAGVASIATRAIRTHRMAPPTVSLVRAQR